MQNKEVLAQVIKWREQGMHSALVTVLSTFGSSPRPAGAMAAIRQDGVIVGSVSGGCIETDLSQMMLTVDWASKRGQVERLCFGKDADERLRYRLPCDNQVRLAIEYDADMLQLQSLLQHMQQQQSVLRCVSYADGRSTLSLGPIQSAFTDDDTGFKAVFGPELRVLIIGATDLGRYLAQMLLLLDYQVVVCDPRIEYTQDWYMPQVTLTTEMPDDAVLAFKPDHQSAVIAVTHDPKLDDMGLIEALGAPCFYVGALGSIRTNQKRRARLRDFCDLSQAQVDKLHGPVGLHIGSRTPAEIAVSIAAALVAAQRLAT